MVSLWAFCTYIKSLTPAEVWHQRTHLPNKQSGMGYAQGDVETRGKSLFTEFVSKPIPITSYFVASVCVSSPLSCPSSSHTWFPQSALHHLCSLDIDTFVVSWCHITQTDNPKLDQPGPWE